MDTLVKIDIEDAFKNKTWSYVPIVTKHGCALGVAVANEKGYSPISLSHYTADTWEEARRQADALNLERGQSKNEAMAIICSTL